MCIRDSVPCSGPSDEPEQPEPEESESEIEDWLSFMGHCFYCHKTPLDRNWSGWAGPGRAGEPVCIRCFGG